jgi:polysaccharide export outer membrane protein
MAHHRSVNWFTSGLLVAAAILMFAFAADAQVSSGSAPVGGVSGSAGYGSSGYGASGPAAPAVGYGAPGAYGVPSAGYGAPGAYGAPSVGYGAPAYSAGGGGYNLPSAGYGQTAPNVGSGYLGTQSFMSWRAAACARDPRNCTSGPASGYLGPNVGPLGSGNYIPYSPVPTLGPNSGPGYGASFSPNMGPSYGPASTSGYGASFGPMMGNPGMAPSLGGNMYGYSGNGMPWMPMGYAGGTSATTGFSAGSANPANSQMPSLNGPPPAGGFPSSSGFPNSGTLGQGFTSGSGLGSANLGGSGLGGGLGSQGLSNLVGGMDQNTLNTIAAQLGVSGDELNKLKTQIGSGAVSPDQIQQLSARFSALNLSNSQITAIGRTLGLSDSQLGSIQQMLASAKGAPSGPPNQGFGMPPSGMMPPNGMMPNGMPPNGMPPNGMMPNGMPPNGMPPNGMTQPLPSPNGMAGANGMPMTNSVNMFPSPIEAKFQIIDNPFEVPPPPATDNLVQFGYNFFAANVSTFAPVGNIPVGNDYVIGPGDEIDILLWGRVNTVLNPVVDRQGMIQLTELGPIQVAGLTFGEAKKLIESKAKKMTGTQVDVTMGQLRTITVTVAGDVTQPGSYQISALARVSNALVAAGGVSKFGSLRRVEVRNGNQLVDVIDLYDILLHGNNSADRRLEDGDVIFVPVIGSVVAVAGEVNRPAIYELKKDHSETLGEVLKLAGGVTGFGFGDHVQVERVQEHRRMIALDVSLKRLTNQNFTIRDGDVVKIYPVLPGRVNSVVLSGNVRRPGEYQWYKGMRVSDLIKKGEGILPNTYFKYALIRRLTGPEKTVHFLQVDLADALSNPRVGRGDTLLNPKDEVDIYNLDDIRDLPSVAVNGEVRLPGRFVLSPDMKVSDLVYMAGGLRDDAYQDRVVLVRSDVNASGKAVRRYLDVNLRAILKGQYNLDIALQANDELFVRTILDWQRPPEFVEISGEVRIPGIYDYYPGMRVSDLVANAGGTLDDAYLKKAELARTEVINGSTARHLYLDVDLRSHAGAPNDKNILLKPNDELLIKAASNYHLPYTVLVSGKIMRPGVYTIRDGERLHSLLERCGGFLPDAFVSGIVFTRVSVQQVQQQVLNDARERLAKEAANAALAETQLASASSNTTSTSSNTVTSSMMLLQNVLTSSENQQADGRMVIHISPKLDGKSGPDDVVLEDGDQIVVPKMPSSVNVMGEVNHPSSFLRLSSYTVRDYINEAGGFTQFANKKQAFVIKADGSVLTADGYDQSRRSALFPVLPLISGGLMSARLDVGDTVFVPENLTQFQDLQVTKDITTIIANSAQGLAVLALLATQL